MRLARILAANHTSGNGEAIVSDTQVLRHKDAAHCVDSLIEQMHDVGVGREHRLMVLARKSVETVALVHACLKAGIVFVPVDPDAPAERLRFILNDCAPHAMVVDRASLDHLGKGAVVLPSVPVLAFDDDLDRPMITKLDLSRPTNRSEPQSGSTSEDDDLAYIMYTSGSTGVPKGVAVSRGALANFISGSLKRAGYDESTRFLSFFPLHFDPVLMEIIVPWVLGGTVVLFGTFLFINDLVRALQQHAITDFSCTPNVVSMLVGRVSSFAAERCPHLRSIWFGGERAHVPDIRAFHESAPSVRLFNGYGPTETVVACSVHEVTSADLEKDNLPIGAPLPGVHFTLWADGKEVIVDDEPGELLVGGSQVMTGYWGVEDDTVTGFVRVGRDRLFRTRDLVTRRNGIYYFLDRVDDMIKVRGFRVFPSEVSRALNSLEDVSDSYVFADHTRSFLVAAVESNTLGRVDPTKLPQVIARHLASKVPSYMVPSKVLVQDSLPRMRSGKLDTQAIKNMTDLEDSTHA